ncbi:MAG: hypothetical protein NVSMB1_14050 [Polyangiales bacterium]
MLDPRTIRALSARPGDNGRDLNLAIAEEGDAFALVSLLRFSALDGEVVAQVAERILGGRGVEVAPDEDPPRVDIPWDLPNESQSASKARIHRPWTLERALLALVIAHPNAPAITVVRIAEARADERGFLLAASIAPHAPVELAEQVATLPAQSVLHDRPFIDLLSLRPDVAAISEKWSHGDGSDGSRGSQGSQGSRGELLREAAARLSVDAQVLQRLSHDPSRRVRRAVARNPSAANLRAELAQRDEAIEVRACASVEPHPLAAKYSRAMLSEAVSAIESFGIRSEESVDAILAHADALDSELAWLAGLVLDPESLSSVAQALAEHDASHPAARAIVASAMVREGDDRGARADLAAMLSRAIARSYVPASTDARGLTGHARLVAFLAELLSDTSLVDEDALVTGLSCGALASDPSLAARWMKLRAARSTGMIGRLASKLGERADQGTSKASAGGRTVRAPPCALEAAWSEPTLALAEVLKLTRVVRPRREVDAHLRGRADGSRVTHVDFDPDPSRRPATDISKVVEALDPWVRVSARVALVFLGSTPKALAIGGREVRGWRDGVVASHLQRILRAARGSAEVEVRVAALDAHADEAGIAVALLAKTARASEGSLLIQRGLRLADGLVFAATIDALWALDRRDDVKALVDAIASRRKEDTAALTAWLVVGDIDRSRTVSVLAGALDAPCASTTSNAKSSVYEALMLIERRTPGTLERLRASSRAGQAAVVNALARAYPGLIGH